jgi:hypothetical protein
VEHDFRFTDELAASGIRFVHRVVDEAGRNYKGVHYDHGNGIAIADVDGDGHDRITVRWPSGREQVVEGPIVLPAMKVVEEPADP